MMSNSSPIVSILAVMSGVGFTILVQYLMTLSNATIEYPTLLSIHKQNLGLFINKSWRCHTKLGQPTDRSTWHRLQRHSC